MLLACSGSSEAEPRFPSSGTEAKGSPAITDCRGSRSSPRGLVEYYPTLYKPRAGSVKREGFTFGKHFQGANISLLLTHGL